MKNRTPRTRPWGSYGRYGGPASDSRAIRLAAGQRASRRPEPRLDADGHMRYPVYGHDGRLLWVSVPED
jgi:hypothetical protein